MPYTERDIIPSFTESQCALLREWADTLETTSLRQGRGWLCLKNYYCCLGVYAKIHLSKRWMQLPSGDGYLDTHLLYRLPEDVEIAMGLRNAVHEGENILTPLVQYFLAMNDKLDMSFTDIAREIHIMIAENRVSEVLYRQVAQDFILLPEVTTSVVDSNTTT